MSRQMIDPENLDTCKWETCGKPRHFDKVRGHYRSPYCSMHYRRRQRGVDMDAPARQKVAIPGQKEQRKRLKRFSLSELEYADMLAAQDGLCAICRLPEPEKSLSIDHDHSCCSGKESCGKCVRGLLCTRCNWGLSYFNDDIGLFRAAIAYLEESR